MGQSFKSVCKELAMTQAWLDSAIGRTLSEYNRIPELEEEIEDLTKEVEVLKAWEEYLYDRERD